MLLFRSLSLGLLGACFTLLVSHSAQPSHPAHVQRVHARHHHHRWTPPPPAEVSVLDVASGIVPAQLPTLLHLRGDERVLAVDDQPVHDDLAAGALLDERARAAEHRSFIDLTVGTTQHGRRMLLLLH